VADFNVAVVKWAERRAVARANLTLTPSAKDSEEMASVGIMPRRVEVLPNGTRVRRLPAQARIAIRDHLGLKPETPTVVFVGRLDYPPNLEAVKVICQQIAPYCPGVVFMLVGSNPPKLALPDNVRLIGSVAEVDGYLSASDLAIVPITQGSGTRIKILDAWAAGLPVLSTSAGVSGLEYQNGMNIVIEDDLGRFPDRIRELFQSPAFLADLSRGALEAVIPYRWDAIGPGYVTVLKTLVVEA
jgi:glycosyltransferase involved in cell wall biosynthesis